MAQPSRRRWTLFLTVATAVLILVPAAVWAADRFNDVPNSHTHHNSITWMADNGITVGCNPPTNTNYCPGDNVTRGQMATFMKRLAENKVVDAATAVTAETADNATNLGGEGPLAYTTQINGVACEGGTCPGGAGITVVPILSLDVDVPADGVMQISYMHQSTSGITNDIVQAWVAVDQTANSGCGTWFFAPGQSVPGTYGLVTYHDQIEGGTIAGSAAVGITSGAHSVKLCALGSEAFTSAQGSLSTIWSQVGSGGALATAGAPAGADIAHLEEVFGDVAPLN